MASVQTEQLTVPQAANELGMTPDGVYKLIQRGKLQAVRTSARKTRITRDALDQYVRGQQATLERFAVPVTDYDTLHQQFVERTGLTPEQWLARWKRDEIADTPENMTLVVRAVALHGRAGKAPIDAPAEHPWAVAAFSS